MMPTFALLANPNAAGEALMVTLEIGDQPTCPVVMWVDIHTRWSVPCPNVTPSGPNSPPSVTDSPGIDLSKRPFMRVVGVQALPLNVLNRKTVLLLGAFCPAT